MFPFIWKFIGLFIVIMGRVQPLLEKTSTKCLNSYLKSIELFEPIYVSALKVHLKSLMTTSTRLTHDSHRLILDTGLASMPYSQIFNHMMQLNISGYDWEGNTTLGCKSLTFFKTSLKRLIPRNDFVYLNSKNVSYWTHHTHDSWLNVIDQYPNALVLMNDMTDEDWFENRRIVACSDTYPNPPIHCYLPMIQLENFNFYELSKSSLNSMLLSRHTQDEVKIFTKAYRNLIHCVVPPEQLFVFNLNHISSVEYWTKLKRFLNISLPSEQFNHIVAGGLKAPIRYRDELTNKNVNEGEVSPSVCDDPLHFIPPEVYHRMEQCASQYADQLSDIIGSKFRSFIYNRMMMTSSNTLRRESIHSKRIILNPAPGTTGTSSLFMAMTQLNITSRHYTLNTFNCSYQNWNAPYIVDDDFKILTKLTSDEPIFWADTPMSTLWWNLMKMYPHTRLIITDFGNDTEWLVKRRDTHCDQLYMRNLEGCTTPVPFSILDPPSNLSVEFILATHLSKISIDHNEKAYEAYRSLIRCAVPVEQTMWINFKTTKNHIKFWNNLISFTNVSVSKLVNTVLIGTGVPKVGMSTCMIGTSDCSWVKGRQNDSAIVPSVCALQT